MNEFYETKCVTYEVNKLRKSKFLSLSYFLLVFYQHLLYQMSTIIKIYVLHDNEFYINLSIIVAI